MKTRFSFNSPQFLLEKADIQIRYAEAMIEQAEAAAATARALIERAADAPHSWPEMAALHRVRLLDRLDLVLTSAEGRLAFKAQAGAE